MDDRGVPEADVDRRRPDNVFERAFERRQAELSRLLGPRLHVGLVDLHDVGPCREEVDDLVVDGAGVGEGELALARVGVVLGLLRHRERAGHGDLDQPVRIGPQELHVADLHGMLALDRADDAGYRVWMAATIERRSRIVDVDAGQGRREPVRVALATGFAVGDDVQPRSLLVVDGEQRRVVLSLLEVRRIDAPELGRPRARREAVSQALAIDQPVGLGIRPDEARRNRVRHGRGGHEADATRSDPPTRGNERGGAVGRSRWDRVKPDRMPADAQPLANLRRGEGVDAIDRSRAVKTARDLAAAAVAT